MKPAFLVMFVRCAFSLKLAVIFIITLMSWSALCVGIPKRMSLQYWSGSRQRSGSTSTQQPTQKQKLCPPAGSIAHRYPVSREVLGWFCLR